MTLIQYHNQPKSVLKRAAPLVGWVGISTREEFDANLAICPAGSLCVRPPYGVLAQPFGGGTGGRGWRGTIFLKAVFICFQHFLTL